MSPNSIVVAVREQVSCDLTSEAIILNLKDGVYYGLDGVGARVWNLLQERCTISEVRNELVREYDVEADRCERDLLMLLDQLVARGLVEVYDDDAPPT